MRGAQVFGRENSLETRIIPADAGSTTPMWTCLIGSEDHPRGCGEHFSKEYGADWRPGSSPRMRGAPHGVSFHLTNSGIIPADAGSTAD